MSILTKVILITAFIFIYLSNLTFAQNPGDLDTTFGVEGKVTTDIFGSSDGAWSIALQADGKIILAGYSFQSPSPYREITLVRYLPDGNIDNSFGTDGIVITDVSNRAGEAFDIAIQSDSKIVVGGWSEDTGTNGYDFTVVRYDSTGTPDNTFGISGVVRTEIRNGNDVIESIAIQPDGKIIAAGWATGSPTDDIALVRYNVDGSLDNSFDGDGIVVTDINSTHDYVKAVTIQTNGKIVVTGSATTSGLIQTSIFVARYDSSGNLDATFGSNGIVITAIGTGDYTARGEAITIQQDGKIIVAGISNSTGSSRFTLVRYNTDGNLDNSFGSNGIVVTTIGSNSEATSIAIDNNGYIITGGRTYINNQNFALARYNESGSLDATFGNNGIVITNFIGSSQDYGHSLELQSDGKILLAGEISDTDLDFGVARYIGRLLEIILVSPNGGEVWCGGTTQNITWVDNIPGNVEIQLFRDSVFHSTIVSSTPSDGLFAWNIPSGAGGGSNYLIRIASIDDGNIFDFSDSTFTIGCNINIISPNGGEIWLNGTQQDITWSSINVVDVKIELSLNNGASWSTITNSTVSTGIYSWLVNASQTSIQSLIRISEVTNENNADQSDDVFTIDIVPSVEANFIGIPESYKLLQNYPNPFNPSTTIYYGLPEESSVEITIYGVLGNEVMVYSEDKQEAGYHNVKFDATELPSGIYLYQLRAGNFIETKKMVLLR